MVLKALLFLLISAAYSIAAAPAYDVSFRGVTPFGEQVTMHITELSDSMHHRDLASRCEGLLCKQIPEGAYSYAVVLDGTGRKVTGTAVIYRTSQVVVVDVGTPADESAESTFPTIKGQVAGVKGETDVWIRLQPLYSDTSVSARVNPDGSFELDDLRPGKWMLLVLKAGELIHFEPFTCQPANNPPLRIEVKGTGDKSLKADALPSPNAERSGLQEP